MNTDMMDGNAAFLEGIDCVLKEWDILNVAIKNGWCGSVEAGHEKRADLFEEVAAFFVKFKNNAPFQLREHLYGILLEDFGVMAEDGSIDHVTRLLSTLYIDCIEKQDFKGLQILMQRRTNAQGKEVQVIESSENESNEDMEMDVSERPERAMPEVDEDGWTTVRRH